MEQNKQLTFARHKQINSESKSTINLWRTIKNVSQMMDVFEFVFNCV